MYERSLLDEAEKDKRLDDYFRVMESFDRATFPDMEGNVDLGVPQGYLPDGFIDLGTDSNQNPGERYGRPMNYVDTYNTLHRHKALFAYLFANLDPSDINGEADEIRYQQIIISNVALEIASTMPTGEPVQAERGGILPISSVVEARCQQHALTAQVLLQAFGVHVRLSKNYLAGQEDINEAGLGFLGGNHVSNVVSMLGRQYMLDTTTPQTNNQGEWMFGLFRMDQQLPDGSWLVKEQRGDQRKYLERNNMYWTIQRQQV